MKKNIKKWISFAVVGAMSFSFASCSKDSEKDGIVLDNVEQAKNIILLIGDGMGPNQITAGEIFKGEKLCLQNFPYFTKVETCSANNEITDSAAAGTALSTGTRTNNGMIGRDPNGADLRTIVDIAHDMGKRTGIIATEGITGATPMAFAAHADNRGQELILVDSASSTSNADMLLSYTISSSYERMIERAGYTRVEKVDEISEAEADKIFGTYLIDAKAPSMSADESALAFDRIVVEALEYLSKDEDGFFLMAEGSHIDHGGHNNDITYMLDELLAFDDGVKAVLEWAEDRDDTVVIVTADHETGGLYLEEGMTQEHLVEAYNENSWMTEYFWWTTGGHTSTDVWCYINGADVDFSQYSFGMDERIMNTDVFRIMCDLFGVEN